MTDSIMPLLSWLIIGVGLAALALGLWAAAHALLNKNNPAAALGWALFCITVPFVAPLCYILFGINRIQRRADRLAESQQKKPKNDGKTIKVSDLPRQNVIEPSELEKLEPLAQAGQNLTGNPLLASNQVQALVNGDTAFPAMLDAINNANKQIWLQTYLFDYADTGRAFVDALCNAHDRGVSVNVLIDGVGGLFLGRRAHRALRRHGIACARFIPPRLFPPAWRINLRNHRKLMIVDGKKAFTGGLNLDSHCVLERAGDDAVRDLHFSLQGPVIDQLAQAFADDWLFATGSALELTPNQQTPSGPTAARAIVDAPTSGPETLTNLMCAAVSRARQQVRIITPYFLPPPALVGALRAAALSGIKVTVITPRRSDHRIVSWATDSRLDDLLQAGVRILKLPAPFAHTKLMMIDNEYALMGSANLDPRSLNLNFELCVELYHADCSTELEQLFKAYASEGTELSLADWQQRSLPVRLRDSMAWLGSPYL